MKTSESASVQEATYQQLRHWLTLGRVLPGQRLKIHDLANTLQVGAMPVRAALARLVGEGALKNTPNAGVMVPRLSRAEFDDVLATRLLLEGEAAERGARALTPEQRQSAEQLVHDMGRAVAEQRRSDYLDANEAFHLLLYRAAASPLLLELIDTVWMRIGPLSNRLDEDAHVWSSMNDAHEEVLRALRRDDSAGVRRAIEKDLFCAGQYLRSLC